MCSFIAYSETQYKLWDFRISLCRIWRWISSGLSRLVHWQKFTDVSEGLSAITMAMRKLRFVLFTLIVEAPWNVCELLPDNTQQHIQLHTDDWTLICSSLVTMLSSVCQNNFVLNTISFRYRNFFTYHVFMFMLHWLHNFYSCERLW